MPAIEDLVEFKTDIPLPSSLKTGDVLFPRKVKRYESRNDPSGKNQINTEGSMHPTHQSSALGELIGALNAENEEALKHESTDLWSKMKEFFGGA